MFQNDYKDLQLIASTALTNSYVPTQVVIPTTRSLEQYNQLTLYVAYTAGSLNSMSIKIEFSNDETNWYEETIDAVDTSTGIISEKLAVRTLSATGNYRIPVKIIDRYIRVSVIGTGTATGSSVAVTAILALVI